MITQFKSFEQLKKILPILYFHQFKNENTIVVLNSDLLF